MAEHQCSVTFGGITFTVSEYAVKRVENWPVKRRSMRLHKKLIKKLGPQFSDEPCIISGPFGKIIHPRIYDKLRSVTTGDQ